MKNIFLGLILVFLDINITIGNGQIGLIPDFIGYIIMINGLAEMARESNYFSKAKPWAIAMAVYTGIQYFLTLIGFTSSWIALALILGITAAIVSLYISYAIVMGVKEMEGTYGVSLNGDSLKATWMLLAVFSILSFVALIIPALALIFLIASFVVAIIFLFAFNKAKNLYERIKTRPNEIN